MGTDLTSIEISLAEAVACRVCPGCADPVSAQMPTEPGV
jgi:hypothetical protein